MEERKAPKTHIHPAAEERARGGSEIEEELVAQISAVDLISKNKAPRMAALSQIALRRLPSFRSVGLKSINKAATAFHISQSRATLAACRSFSDTAGPLAVARDMCEVDNETLVELSIEGSVGEFHSCVSSIQFCMTKD